MNYDLLVQKITDQYKSKLPFALYSLPASDEIICYFQKDTEAYYCSSFIEKGVVFAPFSSDHSKFLIPENKSEVVSSKFPNEAFSLNNIKLSERKADQKHHLHVVDKAKLAIESKKAHKIVVSRRKKVAVTIIELEALLIRLINLFPETFRYLWYHPETGLWFGASPELLVKTDGVVFNTMSLAGTKKVHGDHPITWTSKEEVEQKYVTDAIIEGLQKITSAIKVSKTITQMAGSIAHLRTDITGVLNKGKTTLASITEALHPTPAVCGTPREYAREFILENEGYDREFYTGFVGPIAQNNSSSSLIVNLRCVKIEANSAYIYVGGGITSDSIAEDEWTETQNKLQIMLQVLQPFLK